MKTKILSLVVAVAFVIMAASCTSVAPLTATSNPVGAKVGEATAKFVFGFPLKGGDYGIQLAAKNGGISKISTVDVKTKNLFVMVVRTTIVTGE